MACSNVQGKANFTRLSRLLVDKGTEALRNTFDAIHPPATLANILALNQPHLKKLKSRVIYANQWNLLYPPSGNPPDSKTFDVSLLTVLLRNICGLSAPATGWHEMPPDTDRSTEANITRIKLFRNEVYAHATDTEMDAVAFQNLWPKISQALVCLNVPQQEIDHLKDCPLSPEEEEFIEQLKLWEQKDQILVGAVVGLSEEQKGVKRVCEKIERDLKKYKREDGGEILSRLPKFNFNGNIAKAKKWFHEGTRKWLLQRLDNWFAKEKQSRVMILTAGPGFGKSVFAGKACEIYRKAGKLAAHHFFHFNDSNLKNPITMLQSLASHICDSIEGFKEKLVETLKRPHEVTTPREAFRVYLNDPLHSLEVKEPMLIVIDGFDESATDGKSEMLELIAEEFPFLPEFVKILVTSRPEIPVKEKLKVLNPIEILPGDFNNEGDLQQYFEFCLDAVQNKREIIPVLVQKCEGSFLYAFYVQDELLNHDCQKELTVEEVENFLPSGVGSVYKKYFRRLENDLQAKKNNLDFSSLLEILAAAGSRLPLTFIADVLGMKGNTRAMKQLINGVNEAISSLLFVSDDMVSIFHKSMVDWLLSRGYEEHLYTVQGKRGHKLLWQQCERQFQAIKKGILDLQWTNSMIYSLNYGFTHLLSHDVECPAETYTWLVQIAIVYVMIRYLGEPYVLYSAWRKVLEKGYGLSLDLRMKISWHYFEIEYYKSQERHVELLPYYLQCVVNNYPKRLLGKEDINMAKFILSSHYWFQNLNACVVEEKNMLLAKLLSPRAKAVTVSSDNKLVAVADEDVISFLSLPELEELWRVNTWTQVQCLSFHPHNCLLLFGQLDVALDVRNKEQVQFFCGRTETFLFCAFSPSGRRMVTSNDTNVIKLWDVTNHELITSLRGGPDESMNRCSFTESGLFITGKWERSFDYMGYKIAVWNALTFQRVDKRYIGISKGSDSPLNKAVVCKNCLTDKREDIVFYCDFDRIHVLIAPHFVPISVRHNRQWINASSLGLYLGRPGILLFSECGFSFFELAHFTTIDVCASFIRTRKKPFILKQPTLIPVGENLWLQQDSEKLVYFSIHAQNHEIPLLTSCVVACTFSPDSSRLATCMSDGFINIWSVDNCKVVKRFKANDGSRCAAAWWCERFLLLVQFVGDVAVLSNYPVDHRLTIMETEVEHQKLSHIVDESLEILAFSDGILIFQDNGPPTILYVNEIDKQQTIELPRTAMITSFAISPGGSTILGANNGTFIIWRMVQWPTVYEVVAEWSFPDRSEYVLYEDDQFVKCCVNCDGKFGVITGTEIGKQEPYRGDSDKLLNQEVSAVFMVVDMNSGKLIDHYRDRSNVIVEDCYYSNLDRDDNNDEEEDGDVDNDNVDEDDDEDADSDDVSLYYDDEAIVPFTVVASSKVITFNDNDSIKAYSYVDDFKIKASYPLRFTRRESEQLYYMSGCGKFLAIPLENGNMEFIQIHIPH